MSIIEFVQAVVLGIVEGLTEFLPISSTGHLILAADWLHFSSSDVFVVVIQAGAILAVCWYYRRLIGSILRNLFHRGPEQKLAINTLIAFFPAALIGVCVADFVKERLFNVVCVGVSLILGGVILLWVEHRERKAKQTNIAQMQDLSWREALGVGLAQCFAMIPGTSRSGATIVGGLLLGLPRQVATEFSFFLSIPTILGATAFDLWHSREVVLSGELSVSLLLTGVVVSFFSALVVVKWLIRYVSNHDFKPFGWYRIGFGALILLCWAEGGLS